MQIYALAAARPVWQVRAGELVAVSQGCFLDAGEAMSLSGETRPPPAASIGENKSSLQHVLDSPFHSVNALHIRHL